MKRHLNDVVIAKLPPSERGQYCVWDHTLPGFAIRCSTHSKTFVLKQANRWHTLGRYPIISLKQARGEARRRLALKYFPQSDVPVFQATQEYLQAKRTTVRPKSHQLFELYLRRLPNKAVASFRAQELYDLLPQGQAAANLAFATFRAFFSWCVERDYIQVHPLSNRRAPYKLKSRERLLTDDEIRVIWNATHTNPAVGPLFRVLILSGQRISQFSRFRPEWVQGESIIWPPTAMKNGQQHVLPLTKAIRDNLPSPVTPALINAFKRTLPIKDFRPHDFRRYHSSLAARLRIDVDVEETILAHKTGSRSSIQRVYDRYDRLDPVRDALRRIERHLFQTVLREQT